MEDEALGLLPIKETDMKYYVYVSTPIALVGSFYNQLLWGIQFSNSDNLVLFVPDIKNKVLHVWRNSNAGWNDNGDDDDDNEEKKTNINSYA